ncbi:hypothetical protein KM043_002637 [Ampulex compressa]|nr:hypothetical protein KM043_002637 [Ampulex compressa]
MPVCRRAFVVERTEEPKRRDDARRWLVVVRLLHTRTRIACLESENRSDSARLTARHGKRAPSRGGGGGGEPWGRRSRERTGHSWWERRESGRRKERMPGAAPNQHLSSSSTFSPTLGYSTWCSM